MALTQSEVLDLFSQVAAIKNSDQLLMITSNGDGTVTATKITAELLRRYINAGYELTVDGDGYLCIGGVRTEIIANATQKVLHTETQVSITPNVLHVWQSGVSSLTIGFDAGSPGQMNEYMLEFTVSGNSFSLTLPSSVRWVEEPEWEDGRTYQVSVVDDLAIYGGWDANS